MRQLKILILSSILFLELLSSVLATEIIRPSMIQGPKTIYYPSQILSPSEVIFPPKVTYPTSIIFQRTIRFPPKVVYPSRVSPQASAIVRPEDIPHLDPLSVQWLLGKRERPMVPMRVLDDGRVIPFENNWKPIVSEENRDRSEDAIIIHFRENFFSVTKDANGQNIYEIDRVIFGQIQSIVSIKKKNSEFLSILLASSRGQKRKNKNFSDSLEGTSFWDDIFSESWVEISEPNNLTKNTRDISIGVPLFCQGSYQILNPSPPIKELFHHMEDWQEMISDNEKLKKVMRESAKTLEIPKKIRRTQKWFNQNLPGILHCWHFFIGSSKEISEAEKSKIRDVIPIEFMGSIVEE